MPKETARSTSSAEPALDIVARRDERAPGTTGVRSRSLRRSWLIATIIAVFVAGQSFAIARNEAGPGRPGSQAVTPIPGICDTDKITDVFPDLTDKHTKREQIAFIQGRIVQCSRDINAALARQPTAKPTRYWLPTAPVATAAPTATPVCTNPPDATLGSDRIALYASLGRCFAYLTYLNALPTPEPTESPLSRVASRPTFYVFATGAADPTAASVLIRSVVERLTKAEGKAGDGEALSDLWVVGRADWTATSNFTSQCQLDPNTRGALIIQTSIPETYRQNYLLIVANFSSVSASVEMLGCGSEDHNSATSPVSLWSQQAITGHAHQDAWMLGTLVTLATFLSVSKTTTTFTRSADATTVTNTDKNTPALTGTLLSSFQGENLNVPAQNASVGLDVASRRFADATMQRLATFCNEPQIKRLAAESDPKTIPAPPPSHRTLLYKAAYEYIANCALFADFAR